MTDIRERLRSLDPLRKTPVSEGKRPPYSRHSTYRLKGSIISTPSGECLVRKRIFPLEFSQGNVLLGSLLDYEPDCLVPLTRDVSLQQFDFRKTIFLDIETTGLSGGTGTYAFLVGVGYYDVKGFEVVQIFMRDFHEEKALLNVLLETISGFSSIVSYNGKCFDVPLLVTRFIYSRMKNMLQDCSHFDLLYPVRRLWGRRLENCTLGTVEEDILGLKRENDVPGWMVPSLYFEYLQSGRSEGIENIFDHNLLDVLSLAALTVRICRAVQDPLSVSGKNGLDLYSLGRIFDQGRDFHQSIQCYLNSLKSKVPLAFRQDALRKLSFAYKRVGEWEKATQLWRESIDKGTDFELYPYEELAKYYEHRERDYKKAIGIVERALSAISTLKELRELSPFEDDEADLQYRLNRLRQKERGEWYSR